MTTAMGISMLGIRAICSRVPNSTPKMTTIMTASSVATLCLIHAFAIFIWP